MLANYLAWPYLPVHVPTVCCPALRCLACRWKVEAPEPRPGLKLGYIPGSTSLAFANVLQAGRWVVRRPAKLLP